MKGSFSIWSCFLFFLISMISYMPFILGKEGKSKWRKEG